VSFWPAVSLTPEAVVAIAEQVRARVLSGSPETS
jgi:hypothetical protein